MKERRTRKFGRIALAILKCLGNSGEIAFQEILNPRRGLGASIRKIKSMPDISAIYEDLKNIEMNSLRTVIWRLKQKGLLTNKEGLLSLTETGAATINNNPMRENRWDGKWRMIFFDIPENRRGQRNWLRAQLKNQEFRMVQQSVFIGKAPLDQATFEHINELGLGHCLRMMTVGEIDDESLTEI